MAVLASFALASVLALPLLVALVASARFVVVEFVGLAPPSACLAHLVALASGAFVVVYFVGPYFLM